MPKVSIIVPVYNAGKYIEKCVTSILCQEYTDFEVLLVDDGSTDESGDLCDCFEKKDIRVKTIHQKNQGVSVARNTGLENANGKWITFVDADDWVDKDYCSKVVEYIEKKNADIVFISYYTSYANGDVPSKLIDLEQGDISQEKELIIDKTVCQYYGGNVKNNGVSAGTTWGKFIKREIIFKNNIRFVPGLVRAQDTVFWLHCIQNAEKIYLLDECLYYYRINDESICSGTKYMPNCEAAFSQLLKEYRDFYDLYNKRDDFLDAYQLRVIQVLGWIVEHNLFHTKNNKSIIGKTKELKRSCQKEPFKSALQNARYTELPKSLRVLYYCCRRRMYMTYYAFFWFRKKTSVRTKH